MPFDLSPAVKRLDGLADCLLRALPGLVAALVSCRPQEGDSADRPPGRSR